MSFSNWICFEVELVGAWKEGRWDMEGGNKWLARRGRDADDELEGDALGLGFGGAAERSGSWDALEVGTGGWSV